jgi:hypothetical protein
MRIVIVFLLVWALAELISAPLLQLSGDDTVRPYRVAFAFLVGVFPQVGWQVIAETVKARFKTTVKSLESAYPLSDLDGLTPWYEARLLEAGIEDMQNLATTNLVETLLNTRIPIERLVDWVDQSLLQLHLGGLSDRQERMKVLRSYGIRAATDLEDALTADPAIAQLLDPGQPNRLTIIREALRNEPNLFHVREWKSFPQAITAPVQAKAAASIVPGPVHAPVAPHILTPSA